MLSCLSLNTRSADLPPYVTTPDTIFASPLPPNTVRLTTTPPGRPANPNDVDPVFHHITRAALATPTNAENSNAVKPRPVMDGDATAAVRFWLPNDLWQSITPFSSREDVLNLRATSKQLTLQVDRAVTSASLENDEIARFIRSSSLKHIKSLHIREPAGQSLEKLITYLKLNARPGLTLALLCCKGINAHTIERLMTLPLAALDLKWDISIATLGALASCRFPIRLSGTFGEHALVSASRIATLESLVVYGGEIVDDDMAALFSAHPALQVLSIRIGASASSGAIAALARIPRLRHLSLACWEAPHFDALAGKALAQNKMLQSLEVRGQNLSEASFAALSSSTSLTSLKTEVRRGMLTLANMTSLKHLQFINDTWMDWMTLTAATAHSVAALPKLTSLTFDKSIDFEERALATIIQTGRAKRLEIREWFNPTNMQVSALLANTRLRELVLASSTMPEQDRVALCNHPTLNLFSVNREDYRRPRLMADA